MQDGLQGEMRLYLQNLYQPKYKHRKLPMFPKGNAVIGFKNGPLLKMGDVFVPESLSHPVEPLFIPWEPGLGLVMGK